jgi:hypothetical protein
MSFFRRKKRKTPTEENPDKKNKRPPETSALNVSNALPTTKIEEIQHHAEQATTSKPFNNGFPFSGTTIQTQINQTFTGSISRPPDLEANG